MNTWKPILVGDKATRAWEVIKAISTAIVKRDFPAPIENLRARLSHEEALFLCYVGIASEDDTVIQRGVDNLNKAVGSFPVARAQLGLYGGLSGLGWTVEHVSSMLKSLEIEDEADDGGESGAETISGDSADLNEETDLRLLPALKSWPWSTNYDLISGLAGIGVYFLERWPHPNATEALSLILDHLEATSQVKSTGITWHTPPELLPPWQRELHPEGYYNLGVAHGVPGIIYLLGETIALGVHVEQATRLLDGSLRWLMASQRAVDAASRFGPWIGVDGSSSDTGLGWCYGDTGIAGLLLQVAARTGRAELEKFGRDILNDGCTRSQNLTTLRDSCLCHGRAGTAHVYNRAYQNFGDSRLRDTALMWFDKTLTQWQPGRGVGGFLMYRSPEFSVDGQAWTPTPAFLDGSIGVAMALLAAVTSQEPQWDRLLLLSGR